MCVPTNDGLAVHARNMNLALMLYRVFKCIGSRVLRDSVHVAPLVETCCTICEVLGHDLCSAATELQYTRASVYCRLPVIAFQISCILNISHLDIYLFLSWE